MANDQPIQRVSPVWLVLCLCMLLTTACCKPPIRINLASDGTVYEPDAPIRLQVRVFNEKTDIFGRKQAVVARRGFFDQDFHLRLTILDPDGLPAAKIHPESVVEPAPPYRSGDSFIVPVEIIQPDAENIYLMKDVRDYYRLEGTAGWYTAQVRASLETFCRYTEAPSGELSAELFAKCNRTYNLLVSNKIRFEILPRNRVIEATVRAHVSIVAASGGSTTEGRSRALENAEVRLYRVAQLPKTYRQASWEAYRGIWNRVQPQSSLTTNSKGETVFSGIQRDAYLLLARHPAFADIAITGSFIPKADDRWQSGKVVEVNLNAGH